MTDPKTIQQLKIKTNVVKRLLKDVECYKKEAEKEKERIKALEQKDPQAYELRKMNETYQETLGMVPIVQNKVKMAHDDLQAFIKQNEATIQGAPELELAQEQLNKSATV